MKKKKTTNTRQNIFYLKPFDTKYEYDNFQVFIYNHLDKILDKYSLKRAAKSAISAYAKKCAEVSWWMVVQKPPMFILPGDEDAEFDTQLYKEYKKGGKFKVIEFIIWPALLDKEGGKVISKGIAQG